MRNFLIAIFLIFSFISCGNKGNDGGGNGSGGNGDGGDGGVDPILPIKIGDQIVSSGGNSYNSGPLKYIDPRLWADNVIDMKQAEGEPLTYMYDKAYGVFNYIAPENGKSVVFTVSTKSDGDIKFVIESLDMVYYKGYDSEGVYSCKEDDPDYAGMDCDKYWAGDIELIGVNNLNVWNPLDSLSFKMSSYFVPTAFIVSVGGVDITNLFNKVSDGTISLKPGKKADFLAYSDVESGKILVKIEASNGDDSMVPREALVLVGDSSVSGTLVDKGGGAMGVAAANIPVILYSSDMDRSFITKSDGNGKYSFSSIPSGIYFFKSGDVSGRFSLMGSVDVVRGDKIVLENYLIDNRDDGEARKSLKSAPFVNTIVHGQSFYRPAPLSRSPGREAGESITKGCYKFDNNSYKVVSGASEQVCDNSTKILKGSNVVGVKVSVRTEEKVKPGMKYKYPDKWAFNVNLDNITDAESGNIPSEYSFTGGFGIDETLQEYEYCYNVSELAKTKDIDLKFKLTSQDIGDTSNPTSVLINVSPTCSNILYFGNYKQTQYKIVDEKGNTITNYANLSDMAPSSKEPPVMSLVLTGADLTSTVLQRYETIKIPLKVAYVIDKDNTLDKSELYLIYGNNLEHKLYDDFFKSAGLVEITPANGDQFQDVENVTVLVNDNFTFPPVPKDVYDNIGERNGDFASLVKFELRLTFKTKSDEEVKVVRYYRSKQKGEQFVPLFEIQNINYEAYHDNSIKRYSITSNDIRMGGDGWGRKSTIRWLENDNINLRIGDLSSIHGANTVKSNRSILGHKTHKSGVDIDLRYTNPIDGIGKIANNAAINEFSKIDNNTKLSGDEILNIFTGVGFNSFNFADANPIQNEPLNGRYDGKGIKTLGIAANKEIPQTAFDPTDIKYDNEAVYPKFVAYKSWIVTNRLMIEYYKAHARKFFGGSNGLMVYTGDDYDNKKDYRINFKTIITFAHFYEDNTTTGLPEWHGSSQVDPHHHHWHIKLPNKVN